MVGEAKATLGGTRRGISGRAGDSLASLHGSWGICLCWSQTGRGAEASWGCQGRQSREARDGRTAQAAGERSAHYKYISGVNAREEKSYFS